MIERVYYNAHGDVIQRDIAHTGEKIYAAGPLA